MHRMQKQKIQKQELEIRVKQNKYKKQCENSMN